MWIIFDKNYWFAVWFTVTDTDATFVRQLIDYILKCQGAQVTFLINLLELKKWKKFLSFVELNKAK